MAKISTYICDSCNKPHYKFQSNCFECGGSIIENKTKSTPKQTKSSKHDEFEGTENDAQLLSQINTVGGEFTKLDSKEINEFFSPEGGIQKNAFYLLYGPPGVGKSTFLSQIAKLFSDLSQTVLYNSGEESKNQIKTRTTRLFNNDNEYYYTSSHQNVYALIEDIEKHSPKVLFIDSIQTLYNPHNEGQLGGVSQIKDVTSILMRICKSKDIIVFIIAHMSKDGDLAGPMYLEYMVDGVFFLDSPSNNAYKLLKSEKNRFGKSNELIVFKLSEKGMTIVDNPSSIYIKERGENTVGSVIIPCLEGSNSILIELQSLAIATPFNSFGQRNVNGTDKNRLVTMLAVIEKHLKMAFQTVDVHISIAGGFKSKESGLDLGMVKAIISSFKDTPIPSNVAYIGEVGLLGEVKSVPMIETRIRECKRFGIEEIYLPYHNKEDVKEMNIKNMKINYVKKIEDII
jgi:DNA repair protein RadA/Sms